MSGGHWEVYCVCVWVGGSGGKNKTKSNKTKTVTYTKLQCKSKLNSCGFALALAFTLHHDTPFHEKATNSKVQAWILVELKSSSYRSGESANLPNDIPNLDLEKS